MNPFVELLSKLGAPLGLVLFFSFTGLYDFPPLGTWNPDLTLGVKLLLSGGGAWLNHIFTSRRAVWKRVSFAMCLMLAVGAPFLYRHLTTHPPRPDQACWWGIGTYSSFILGYFAFGFCTSDILPLLLRRFAKTS